VLDGGGDREVDGAGLLGVGEGDGAELRVGVALACHDSRRVEAGALEGREDHVAADAVQRCVGDPEVARGRGVDQTGHPVQVGLDHVVVEGLPVVTAGDRGQWPDRRDLGRDLRVGRRHDLRAVAEVDLVPVVLRRVV
jgi:hypothetical protein